MSNSYFQFKQFTVLQDRCAMKVTTDSCLFGSYVASKVNTEPINCLDIGTGTGLLSLMLAQKNNCIIDALEIDSDAAEQARENVSASPFSQKINIIEADVRNFSYEKKYDLILSNPPFYEKELKGGDLRKNIAHHGEQLSLSELISIIENYLDINGTFYLLLPFKRKNEIERIIDLSKLDITETVNVKQTDNHDYFRIILTGKFKNTEALKAKTASISIKNNDNNYTIAFIELLKDYYLHL